MAKVLKVVAAVAAIASRIPGPWQPFAMALSVGAGIGSSLLAKKPKSPSSSTASYDRLRANIDPRTPRKTAVGIVAMAIDLR